MISLLNFGESIDCSNVFEICLVLMDGWFVFVVGLKIDRFFDLVGDLLIDIFFVFWFLVLDWDFVFGVIVVVELFLIYDVVGLMLCLGLDWWVKCVYEFFL